MTYSEAMGHDISIRTLEDDWNCGFHKTKDGREIELKYLDKSHIINTINYFKDRFDVSPLERELKMRQVNK